GYPDEIFQVPNDLVANWEKYALIVSHTIPFDSVGEALEPREHAGRRRQGRGDLLTASRRKSAQILGVSGVFASARAIWRGAPARAWRRWRRTCRAHPAL